MKTIEMKRNQSDVYESTGKETSNIPTRSHAGEPKKIKRQQTRKINAFSILDDISIIGETILKAWRYRK